VSLKPILFVWIIPALMLSACAPVPQDCARKDVFCAGLVTDFGPITEGINQEAWLGLQDAKDGHLVDRIDAIETIDARDRADNISIFANDGYDVIITVGPSISDETAAAARKYPNLLFVGVEQPQETKIPNLTGLVFNEDRSGFLSGALAALTTQTNQVAALCEENFIDPMRRYCDGFQAGAKYANPGVNVTVSYRDGSQEKLFNDPDWGRTSALEVINEGADVLFAAGGATADAALETAAQQKINVIGAETDPYARLAGIRPWLISSAINDIRTGILELMGLTRNGKFSSGNFFGPTRLAPFHEWDRQIPQGTKDRLNLIEKGLDDGSIRTGIPWLEINPNPPTPSPQD
jgi:basic membrane protein A and related proteins